LTSPTKPFLKKDPRRYLGTSVSFAMTNPKATISKNKTNVVTFYEMS